MKIKELKTDNRPMKGYYKKKLEPEVSIRNRMKSIAQILKTNNWAMKLLTIAHYVASTICVKEIRGDSEYDKTKQTKSNVADRRDLIRKKYIIAKAVMTTFKLIMNNDKRETSRLYSRVILKSDMSSNKIWVVISISNGKITIINVLSIFNAGRRRLILKNV